MSSLTSVSSSALAPVPKVSSEDLAKLSAKLLELYDVAELLSQTLRARKADADLANKFLAVSQETMRGAALLDFIREADRQRQENETLMQVSMNLSSAGSFESVLKTILSSLREVVAFNAAGIFVYNRDLGMIEIDMLEGYEGVDSELTHHKFQEGVQIGQGITGSVIQSGEAIYVQDVRKDARYIQSRATTLSELAVPIMSRGEVIGVFNLESDHLDAFTEKDLNLLTTFASHAAVALERAREDRMRQHTKRIEEEIALARRIQNSFIPQTFPDFSPYDLGGINSPSSAVGGDYFDFIPITDDDLGIAIGDVTGHGVGAALLMANFRACLRIESRNNFAIPTILSKVNDYIHETNAPDSFVTAFYGVLSRKFNVLTYSNAGHNPPFVLHKDNSIEFLSQGGVLLGAFDEPTFEECRLAVNSGDILVFYTDGVTESRNDQSVEFGEKRLIELVKKYRKFSAQEIVDKIQSDVFDYQSEDIVQDDLTISIVKFP